LVDLYFIDYMESIGKRECPICDSVTKATERFFSGLIYEANSGTIKKYADSGGFCPPHASKFISFVQSNPELGGGISALPLLLGQIEIAEEILLKQSNRKKLESHFHCPACSSAKLRESDSIRDLSDMINSGRINPIDLAGSICYPHFYRIISFVTGNSRDLLISRFLTNIKKLRADLLHYRESYAQSSGESIYAAKLWKESIIKFAGKF